MADGVRSILTAAFVLAAATGAVEGATGALFEHYLPEKAEAVVVLCQELMEQGLVRLEPPRGSSTD